MRETKAKAYLAALQNLPGTSLAAKEQHLAERLAVRRREPINPTRLQKWRANGVPATFVLDVEAETRASRHDLDPLLYPREVA